MDARKLALYGAITLITALRTWLGTQWVVVAVSSLNILLLLWALQVRARAHAACFWCAGSTSLLL
jgi:uncharacterized membrane protein